MAGLSVRFTDGTTTVTFAGNEVQEFALKPPAPGAESASQSITIIQTPASTGRTNVNTINRFFERAARNRELGTNDNIYLEIRPTTSDTYYRTLIFSGDIPPDPDQFDIWYLNDYLKFTIQVTHAPWWEGAETQVAISNGNGTNNTSGLTVNNHTTASTSAYFTVAAGVIAGDAPAAVRIELTNATATALGYFIIGLMRDSASWTSASVIQAEAQLTGGTDTADAAASNGSYVALTVSSGELFGAMTWTVPGATMAITDGKQVVPMMRLRAAPSAAVYAALAVAATGGSASSGGYVEITTARQYVLFPSIPLPPISNSGPYADATMTMDTRNAGSSTSIQPDYITLLPTDGLRQYIATQDVLANTETFYDDGIDGYAYMITGGNRQSSFTVIGDPFMLYPGQAATFNVHMSAVTGLPMTPANQVTARLYYRPRRRTL